MTDADRYRLLGTYRTPRVRKGAVLTCEARDDDVIVTGYSSGRIPWPVGRRRGTAARSLVVSGGLAAAVRRESNQAVCHWFGVTAQTVAKWRKALGVGLTNEGTHRLRSDYQQEPWAERARRMAHAKAGDPERRRKIAEAKQGRPRPTPPGWVSNGIAWAVEADELVRTLPPRRRPPGPATRSRASTSGGPSWESPADGVARIAGNHARRARHLGRGPRTGGPAGVT